MRGFPHAVPVRARERRAVWPQQVTGSVPMWREQVQKSSRELSWQMQAWEANHRAWSGRWANYLGDHSLYHVLKALVDARCWPLFCSDGCNRAGAAHTGTGDPSRLRRHAPLQEAVSASATRQFRFHHRNQDAGSSLGAGRHPNPPSLVRPVLEGNRATSRHSVNDCYPRLR